MYELYLPNIVLLKINKGIVFRNVCLCSNIIEKIKEMNTMKQDSGFLCEGERIKLGRYQGEEVGESGVLFSSISLPR